MRMASNCVLIFISVDPSGVIFFVFTAHSDFLLCELFLLLSVFPLGSLSSYYLLLWEKFLTISNLTFVFLYMPGKYLLSDCSFSFHFVFGVSI